MGMNDRLRAGRQTNVEMGSGRAAFARGWVFALKHLRAEVAAGALRADAVGEGGLGVLLDVLLDAHPVAGIVADALAPCADGEEAAEGLDGIEGVLELLQ